VQTGTHWKNTDLEHCDEPKYFGFQLDRTLTDKSHCDNTKD